MKRLKKKLEKIYRKIVKMVFGECAFSHNWKMQHDGWKENPKWNIEDSRGFNQSEPFTKKWIYYKCKRCGAIASKD